MKNNIKVERAKLNLTQEELAQKIAVSRQTINAIESNKFVPSTVLALKLARIFKISVNEIFELDIFLSCRQKRQKMNNFNKTPNIHKITDELNYLCLL